MSRITIETVRQLAAVVGIRPDEAQLAGLAKGLEATLAAIERCDELGLGQHEPAATFQLSGGATDAER